MSIFAEVTENECFNDDHISDNEYIQFGAQQWPKYPKHCHLYFDTPCSAVSLRQPSYLFYMSYMLLRLEQRATQRRLGSKD